MKVNLERPQWVTWLSVYSSLSSLCNSNPSSWWSLPSTLSRMMTAFLACWPLGRRSLKWLGGSHPLMTVLYPLMETFCLESWTQEAWMSHVGCWKWWLAIPLLLLTLGSQTCVLCILGTQCHIMVINFSVYHFQGMAIQGIVCKLALAYLYP